MLVCCGLLASEVHIQLKYLASLLPCGSSKLFQHQCASFSVQGPSGRVISADFGRSESCRGRNMPQLILYLSVSADFFPKVCRNGFLLFDVPKITQVSHRVASCQGTMPQLMMWVGPSLHLVIQEIGLRALRKLWLFSQKTEV